MINRITTILNNHNVANPAAVANQVLSTLQAGGSNQYGTVLGVLTSTPVNMPAADAQQATGEIMTAWTTQQQAGGPPSQQPTVQPGQAMLQMGAIPIQMPAFHLGVGSQPQTASVPQQPAQHTSTTTTSHTSGGTLWPVVVLVGLVLLIGGFFIFNSGSIADKAMTTAVNVEQMVKKETTERKAADLTEASERKIADLTEASERKMEDLRLELTKADKSIVNGEIRRTDALEHGQQALSGAVTGLAGAVTDLGTAQAKLAGSHDLLAQKVDFLKADVDRNTAGIATAKRSAANAVAAAASAKSAAAELRDSSSFSYTYEATGRVR